MKKAITFLLLIAAIGVNAQTKIKSKASGDSIVIQNGAIEVAPVIINAQGDTARSMSWYTEHMHRDTTVGFSINVFLFNKAGAQVSTFGMFLPPLQGVAHYLNSIDNNILKQYKRLIKP